MKVIFIHRSVGAHLLKYGHLRTKLHDKDIQLDDYDNNNGQLTQYNGGVLNNAIKLPGGNTNPDNLATFFSNWPDIVNKYELIMIKSCYPNSHIKSNLQLKTIKQSYETIFAAFRLHNKQLLLITTPPLRPLFTNAIEAKLASSLADWLTTKSRPMLQVFDLHNLYSESSGKHQGMLKRQYRQFLPWDNHPNTKAHQLAAPLIAEMVLKLQQPFMK